MKFNHRSAFLGVSFALLASAASGQNSPQNPYYDPNTEGAFEDAAQHGAEDAGYYGLADAIASGALNIYGGNTGLGVNAWSTLGPPMGIVCGLGSADFWVILAQVFHEWYHLTNPPPPPPPPTGNPAQDKENRAKYDACNEVSAICASLHSLAAVQASHLAGDDPPPCSLIEKIKADAANQAIVCCCGTTAPGPGNTDQCNVEVDCKEGA